MNVLTSSAIVAPLRNSGFDSKYVNLVKWPSTFLEWSASENKNRNKILQDRATATLVNLKIADLCYNVTSAVTRRLSALREHMTTHSTTYICYNLMRNKCFSLRWMLLHNTHLSEMCVHTCACTTQRTFRTLFWKIFRLRHGKMLGICG